MQKHKSLVLGVLLGVAACGPSTPPGAVPEPAQTAAATATPTSASTTAPVSSASPSEIPAAVRAAVDAADRSPDDRALDGGRHPAELLAFFGVAPGQKVAELGAGGGYTTELLARVVGPTGKVWGQNTKFILEKFAEKPWSARLEKPALKGVVVRADREFDDPLPPEATNLDGVFMVLIYHDTVWWKADRAKMLASVFKALKSGGTFGIVDHSGRPGTGMTETETLHRIEEKAVRDEVEKAGFKLAAEASFLKNPADTRDWNDSPRVAAERRGTSDRFVLKFVKP
ncbi:MAG: SAM-dependent methyltransferase [Polyangiaceae bacterium]